MAVDTSSTHQGLLQICNYSRQDMEQTGDGHFCPIGGYCLNED